MGGIKNTEKNIRFKLVCENSKEQNLKIFVKIKEDSDLEN